MQDIRAVDILAGLVHLVAHDLAGHSPAAVGRATAAATDRLGLAVGAPRRRRQPDPARGQHAPASARLHGAAAAAARAETEEALCSPAPAHAAPAGAGECAKRTPPRACQAPARRHPAGGQSRRGHGHSAARVLLELSMQAAHKQRQDADHNERGDW